MQQVVNEVRRQVEKEKEIAIAETKRKKWVRQTMHAISSTRTVMWFLLSVIIPHSLVPRPSLSFSRLHAKKTREGLVSNVA